MVIILDDVVNLNSSFQSDIIEVFKTHKHHTGKTNFNEKWYSLDEDHLFRPTLGLLILQGIVR